MLTQATAGSDLRVDIHAEGAATVIALTGSLDRPLSDANRDRVLSAVKPDAQLILDFTGVAKASGSGLRGLLLLARHIRGLGGAISARGTSAEMQTIAEAAMEMKPLSWSSCGTARSPGARICRAPAACWRFKPS